MTAKEIIDLIEYGARWQLIGAQTGKKLCRWDNTEETKRKYYDCECTDRALFPVFFAPTNKYSSSIEYAYPMINIWVSGE